MHALTRRFDARDRWIGWFIERAVRAGGLADHGDVAFDIQQIVLDLKREAEMPRA